MNFSFDIGALHIWTQLCEAAPIIVSLIIIEGLLSVDNALAIAAMASHLPGKQKYLALKFGIIGAYLFRGLALAGANYFIAYPWVKIVGAAYLIHLMAGHFGDAEDDEQNETAGGKQRVPNFFMTVLAIEMMDLSLSVDNVVAAVAMSPKLWVVCTGVFIGILALRFLAGIAIKLIEKFPILEDTAFLLIGYVGVLLVVELVARVQIGALGKFIGIVIIIALSIWYSRAPDLQGGFAQIFKLVRRPLRLYALIAGFVFGLIFLPFRWLFGAIAALFKKSAVSAA